MALPRWLFRYDQRLGARLLRPVRAVTNCQTFRWHDDGVQRPRYGWQDSVTIDDVLTKILGSRARRRALKLWMMMV